MMMRGGHPSERGPGRGREQTAGRSVLGMTPRRSRRLHTAAVVAALVVVLAGCTTGGGHRGGTPTGSPSRSPTTVSSPTATAASVACRQGYAARFLFGWRPLSNLLARQTCAQVLAWQAGLFGGRSLMPAGAVSAPSLAAPRDLPCRSARIIIKRFHVPFSLTCTEARYVADVLPVTACHAASLPAASGILSGRAIRGWDYPGVDLTSVWIGEEEWESVGIWAGSPRVVETDRGDIWVALARPCDITIVAAGASSPGLVTVRALDGFLGRNFFTPPGIGRVTLTSVIGSLANGTMLISFTYRGGSGTLDPITGRFAFRRR